MKVFLGGTVNGSNWREQVMQELKMDYFNPVVDVWNDEAYERELEERRTCDYLLYIITPKMTGYYSVAEVINDSFHRSENTIFCFLPEDQGQKFSEKEIDQMESLGRLVQENGAIWISEISETISYLNAVK